MCSSDLAAAAPPAAGPGAGMWVEIDGERKFVALGQDAAEEEDSFDFYSSSDDDGAGGRSTTPAKDAAKAAANAAAGPPQPRHRLVQRTCAHPGRRR